jgi:hypothetical protein
VPYRVRLPGVGDREVISAALRALLAAGLITALPLDQWPEYVCLEPPG